MIALGGVGVIQAEVVAELDDVGGERLGRLGRAAQRAQGHLVGAGRAAETEVEGSAGGGVVRVRATGTGEVLDVTLDAAVVDPTDIETLQDLIVAALRDVTTQISRLQAAAMGDLDPGAMLGGLSGLLGGEQGDDE